MFDIWATIAVDNQRGADRLVERFYAAEDLLAAFPRSVRRGPRSRLAYGSGR